MRPRVHEGSGLVDEIEPTILVLSLDEHPFLEDLLPRAERLANALRVREEKYSDRWRATSSGWVRGDQWPATISLRVKSSTHWAEWASTEALT